MLDVKYRVHAMEGVKRAEAFHAYIEGDISPIDQTTESTLSINQLLYTEYILLLQCCLHLSSLPPRPRTSWVWPRASSPRWLQQEALLLRPLHRRARRMLRCSRIRAMGLALLVQTLGLRSPGLRGLRRSEDHTIRYVTMP